jgi:predicted amidohydrolase YtcJ
MHILYNAQIHTLDPLKPHAQALVIANSGDESNSVILATGSNDEILSSFGQGNNHSNCVKTNMEGKIILPGLTDAHLHLEYLALNHNTINCETETRQECLRLVAERALNTPAGEWILGFGWNQNSWNGTYGTAAELDQVAPNHPVYLTAKSAHAAWVNTTALKIARIGESTPDPEDGKIGRDAQGILSGILFEEAMSLVIQIIPTPSTDMLAAYLEKTQMILAKKGITSVHNFDRGNCFSALQILHQKHDLRIRVVQSIPLANLSQANELGLRAGFGDGFLRTGPIKLFADGALGPQTASMLEPYQGNPNTGMLLLTADQVLEYGILAAKNGYNLAIHAIGDRANREVLDGYTRLRAYETENHLPHLRHRIEHVQVLHPDDFPRLAHLNLIASMQPIHATSDMQMADQLWGNKRSTYAYAWQSLLNYGTVLAFGSDAPVEKPDPFLGLHAAVTRCRQNGEPDPNGWHPEQRLSFQQALVGFTQGPAYAAGMENQLGQLSPNFYADLIVLDVDPFTIDPKDIHKIQPCATMINGEWIQT